MLFGEVVRMEVGQLIKERKVGQISDITKYLADKITKTVLEDLKEEVHLEYDEERFGFGILYYLSEACSVFPEIRELEPAIEIMKYIDTDRLMREYRMTMGVLSRDYGHSIAN